MQFIILHWNCTRLFKNSQSHCSPQKGAKNVRANYRPISLLSIFDKILEKLMYIRTVHYFSFHKVFFKFQFGFRKHHSTSLALVELLDNDNLYTKLDEGEVVAGI